MQQFEKMIVEEDHLEGLRINELFDENLGDLAAAIEETETEFSEEHKAGMPGVELYGYSVAKNARRWWMYGTAYLRDLETQEASPRLSAGQLAIYGMEKNHAGEKLIELDPTYFKTFNLLERERVRRHLNGEVKPNPFELARDYASLVLAQAIDVASVVGIDVDQALGQLENIARSSESQEPDEQRAWTFHAPDAAYHVERTPDKRAKSYIISEYGYDGDDLDAAEPRAVYIIDGARNFSGHPIVMQPRGTNPIVETGKILDLANAVIGYKEILEEAVFVRVATILAARRNETAED